jgi:hypothetical protein
LIKASIVIMDREQYNFDGKLPIDCIIEVCRYRNYPEPTFTTEAVDDDNGLITVLLSVSSVPYGLGTHNNFVDACDIATLETLKWWLRDSVDLRGVISPPPPQQPTAISKGTLSHITAPSPGTIGKVAAALSLSPATISAPVVSNAIGTPNPSSSRSPGSKHVDYHIRLAGSSISPMTPSFSSAATRFYPSEEDECSALYSTSALVNLYFTALGRDAYNSPPVFDFKQSVDPATGGQ